MSGKISGDLTVPLNPGMFLPAIDMSLGVGSQNVKVKGSSVRPFITPQAVGDGITDDTVALQNAINAAQTAGCALRIPGTVGGYSISGQLTITGPLDISGDYGGTKIITTSTTADIFNIHAIGVSLHDMTLDASATKTTGNHVNITSGSGDIKIERLTCHNHVCGINMAGTISTIDVHNCYLYHPVATTGVGIQVLGGVDLSIRRVTIGASGTSPQPAAGISIQNCGDCTIECVDVVQHRNGLLISPGTGQQVDSVYCTDSFFDTSTDYGLLIDPSGSGFVQRSRFIGCWFSSHGIDGVAITGAGTIDGIEFHGCHAFNNTGQGWNIGLGSNFVWNACQAAGNGAAGISIAVGGISDFTVVGCTLGPCSGFGPNNVGLFINTGGSDHFIVANNRIIGNTAGQFLNAATGIHTIVAPNLVA